MATRTWVSPAQLDAAAAHVLVSYRGFLTGMVATLAGIFDRPHAATGRARAALETLTMTQLLTTQGNISQFMQSMTDKVVAAGIAVASKPLSSEASDELDMLVNHVLSAFKGDLLSIALRDRITIDRMWHRFSLEHHFAQHRHGRATTMFVRQGKIADLRFRQSDRTGRKYESAMFIRNMARHILVQLQADAAMYAIQQSGSDTAIVTWYDTTLREQDAVKVSISGKTADLPTYAELRDGLFHPNSTARVERA